jgi:hypothetical protein
MLGNIQIRHLCAQTFCSHFKARAVCTLAFLAAASIGWLSSQTVLAAPINYGSFMGNTVTYVDVTEDSNSGDTPPLFGAPTVSGDSLDFDPVGFDANATGPGGVDITDGNLTFMVVAKPGKLIDNIQLSEAGDTTLAGFGTDATFTSVTGTGVLNINEVNGVGIATISEPISLTFSPSGGTFGLLTDGGGGPLFHTFWSGSWSKDITQVLTDHGISGGATKISINIDNTLTALSQSGTFSLIAKKEFGGLSITVNIPEPATWTLMALGMLAVVAARRSAR